MRAELVRLRAAFPEFSFGICPGWRGLTFEAWRDPGAGGLYAVITQDAGKLWRELEKSRAGADPGCRPGRERAAMTVRYGAGLAFELEGVTDGYLGSRVLG